MEWDNNDGVLIGCPIGLAAITSTPTLKVLAKDGTSVAIDATTGNPATAFVTLDTGTEREVFEERWGQWLSAINGKSGLRFNGQPAEHSVNNLLAAASGYRIDETAVATELIEYSTAEIESTVT